MDVYVVLLVIAGVAAMTAVIVAGVVLRKKPPEQQPTPENVVEQPLTNQEANNQEPEVPSQEEVEAELDRVISGEITLKRSRREDISAAVRNHHPDLRFKLREALEVSNARQVFGQRIKMCRNYMKQSQQGNTDTQIEALQQLSGLLRNSGHRAQKMLEDELGITHDEAINKGRKLVLATYQTLLKMVRAGNREAFKHFVKLVKTINDRRGHGDSSVYDIGQKKPDDWNLLVARHIECPTLGQFSFLHLGSPYSGDYGKVGVNDAPYRAVKALESMDLGEIQLILAYVRADERYRQVIPDVTQERLYKAAVKLYKQLAAA